MSQVLLLSSLGALGTGPFVAALARKRPQLMAFIDGFIYVAIGGLVLLDVVPHAVEHRDVLAMVFMVAGFALPTIAEKLLHYGVRQTHTVVLLLALIGIAIHSALDGSALAQSDTRPSNLLGFGVVLHQLPVSLMVWWVLSDRPRIVTWVALGLMALTTVFGYVAEPSIFAVLPERAGLWFEAVVGGSLLHVIAHPAHDHDHDHAHDHGHAHQHSHAHDHAHDHAGHRPNVGDHATDTTDAADVSARPNGMGALAGVALLVVLHLSRTDATGVAPLADLWQAFWSLALDSAPAVLLAYIAAGLVHAYLPVGSLAWMSRGSRPRQALAGMAVGLPLPICSCGVVPLYQQLVQQGASTTAAVAFLVATPELGLDAILLSIPLLGTPFAVVRVVAAALAALAVALIMGRLVKRPRRALPLFGAPSAEAPRTSRDRLALAAKSGLGDMVDHTAPWILLGLFLAALAAPVLDGSWLTRLPVGVDVVVFALVGMPLYVCASASTPLVAVMVAAGVSPGAGLALLLTGPATNVATIGILTRMHGRRFAIGFAAAMTGSAIVLGWLVNLMFPSLPASQPVLAQDAVGTPVQVVAALLVAALFAASVVRRGARGFLSELRLSDS